MMPKKPASGFDPRLGTSFLQKSCSTDRHCRCGGGYLAEVLREAPSAPHRTKTPVP
jgi:hypothetical protein